AVGFEHEPYYVGMNTRFTIWTPSDFGLARMASLGWLYRFAEQSNKADSLVAERKTASESPTATPRELWDWVYLQGVRQNDDGVLETAKRLCRRGEILEKQLSLMNLATREGDENISLGRRGRETDKDDKPPPLAADELKLALAAFDDVRRMA